MYFFFFFKQKTAYELRISDWSSDVCSSDLRLGGGERVRAGKLEHAHDHGGLAREIGVRGIIFGAEFDARHVGDADLAAVASVRTMLVANRRGLVEIGSTKLCNHVPYAHSVCRLTRETHI